MVMISSDNTAINTGVDTNSGQQAGKGAGGFALLMDLPQWEEWARHILKDLEMLHKSIDRLNKKIKQKPVKEYKMISIRFIKYL